MFRALPLAVLAAALSFSGAPVDDEGRGVVAPVSVDPSVRIAKGTQKGASVTSLTITSVSLQQGSTILVGAMDSNNIGDPATTIAAAWNGQAVAQRSLYFPGNFGPRVVLFEKNNVNSGTGSVVVTWTGSTPGQLVILATELTVGAAPDNDVQSTDANNASPISASIAPAQNHEIYVCMLATLGTAADLAGAVANAGTTIGQNESNNGTSLIELYRQQTAPQSPETLGLTNYNGVVGRFWSTIVADFKIP